MYGFVDNIIVDIPPTFPIQYNQEPYLHVITPYQCFLSHHI